MGVCDGRELTQAEREAGYQQQRTGVVQALRPFSGPATVDNLVDYINRELCPAVRNSRNKVNDVFRQVADNAPSANPLSYYFSTNIANADPTTGRVRLNASPQNTATTLRISEENGRLQNVTPWLDVMAGGATTPIGVVTLLDAVNPGRSLRFDLHTMVDQGAYWDLGVTLVESSHPDPFVDGGGVVLSFIAGCASTGATVPVGSLSPVANDTFLGNVSGASAPPSANALSTLAGAGLAFGTHTLDVTGSTSIVIASDQVQRAALTGDVTAPLNSNVTTIASSAVTNAKLANMSPGRVKGLQITAVGAAPPVDLTGAEVGELIRTAFLADGVGAAGTNNDFAIDVRQGIIRVNPGSLGGDVAFTGFALNGGGSTNNAGGRFVLVKQGAANKITLKNATGSSSNNQLILPAARDLDITTENTAVAIGYWGSRWQMLGAPFAFAGTGIALSTTYVLSVDQSFSPTWTNAHTFSAPIISNLELLTNGIVAQNGVASASISTSQTNWNPTGLSSCSVLRVTATVGFLSLGGLVHFLDGARVLIVNAGSQVFTILNDDASTTAANRFAHNVGSFAIAPNDCVEVWYDNITSRWRCIHQTTST